MTARPTAQRGAALLAAMLTVALVATFAAAALWQQWRSVEVEAAERSRMQSSWVLTGALDWARLILREDVRSNSSGGADHLAEPWAVPLQEARLSTFLAADRNSSAEGGDSENAFLSGDIVDLQSQLNVNNLVESGRISETGLRSFQRLFDLLGLPAAELSLLSENLRLATAISAENAPADMAPLAPQRVDQLVWLGLSPQTVAVLEPHVTVLPARTPVNLNTANAEVIYAAVGGISLADAQRLVSERTRAHFRSLGDASRALGGSQQTVLDGSASVASRFFEVRGRLRLGDTVVQERSVVQRDGLDIRTLSRERGVAAPSPDAQAAGTGR
ncbi:type II secretion system minor pseudopilin GspK [Ramlibacter tataouinensis]|uniref:Type II secretion system protein K n=1 Tax=Ramlibacter tataouinensis (strain ATCC BAA-407 / DSM 14655 / LMG 21543 / TTB310) TaxID=365046 RepID=F5Y0Q6_RAMTT|nr:type II secretion system minor pseudopilin GspK [Ramlibacter tataouinensis]AEG94650.1 candidate pseudopilin, general secretion pathway protein K precursor (PilD-dependent protein), component of type II secretion system [Ramlibacter tataouinensis TTB310]